MTVKGGIMNRYQDWLRQAQNDLEWAETALKAAREMYLTIASRIEKAD